MRTYPSPQVIDSTVICSCTIKDEDVLKLQMKNRFKILAGQTSRLEEPGTSVLFCLQRSRSWCCQVEWARPSRPPSSFTPTSWRGTQTFSSCSSKSKAALKRSSPHRLEQKITSSSCPPSLPRVLRVRQFIEMVNGTDSEVRCLGGRSPKSQDSYPGSPRPFSSPSHKASSSQPYLPGTVQLCVFTSGGLT